MAKVKCELCGYEITARFMKKHKNYCNGLGPKKARMRKPGEPDKRIGNCWNKGLTKNTDERIKKYGKSVSKSLKGEKNYWFGKTLSDEMKNKISEGMKRAHLEGKAWNIGKSRWNNEPSYPEKFFMKVIENEFDDKNYKKEFNIGIYSLDFAWPDKKKVIEIDGDKHQRFKEYKERDEKKDEYLIENGWKVLRIMWKDMFNNPKEKIEEAKKFINDTEV